MFKNMASDLSVPMTPELLGASTNEEFTNMLVQKAIEMGKSEEEIGAALGADGKDM